MPKSNTVRKFIICKLQIWYDNKWFSIASDEKPDGLIADAERKKSEQPEIKQRIIEYAVTIEEKIYVTI